MDLAALDHDPDISPALRELVKRVHARASTIDVAEKARRRAGVGAANANAALEGFEPDFEHRLLDEFYIEGKLSIGEILAYYDTKFRHAS